MPIPIVMKSAKFIFAVCLLCLNTFAEKRAASGGTRQVDQALKVTGQTRTLSMQLTLKSKKEKIEFVNPRRNYDKEISQTRY
jgi:hypothetical protein